MFGDTMDIGNFNLIPLNDYDNFMTKIEWTGTTGTDEPNIFSEEIKIFPNPVSDKINIISRKKIVYYEITDNTGRKIVSKATSLHNQNDDVTSIHACHLKINVSTLPSGFYIINLFTSDNKVISKKIIK